MVPHQHDTAEEGEGSSQSNGHGRGVGGQNAAALGRDAAGRRKAEDPGTLTLVVCVSVTLALLAIILRLSG